MKIEEPDPRISAFGYQDLPQGRKWLAGAFLLLLAALLTGGGVFFYWLGGPGTQSVLCKVERFSGVAEYYSPKTKDWRRLSRNVLKNLVIAPGSKLRAAKGADIDFASKGIVRFRLKPGSEVEVVKKWRGPRLGLKVNQGGLLGMVEDEMAFGDLRIETSRFIAAVPRGSFLIQEGRENSSSVSVLDGTAWVRLGRKEKAIEISPLQIFEITDREKSIPNPRRVTYQEWRAVNEARDLIETTPEQEAKQRDLRQEAGKLFRYVFDEGTFFTPNHGFSSREFYRDENKGVTLRIDYDVYPQASFAGTYMKTRDLDLFHFKHFRFQLRSETGKTAPRIVRIEIKDGAQIVRGFAVKPIDSNWQDYAFPLHAAKGTPVSEIVFVFENMKIGALAAKGTLYIRNLSIE